MTIGIYRLLFSRTDKVYIGQSINIEKRFKEHIFSLRREEASKKLQEAYSIYGTPSFEILVECTKEDLDLYEKEAIEIFNSVKNGLNYTSGGSCAPSTKGPGASRAIFSKEQILSVFNLLIENKLQIKEISKLTGVTESAIWPIAGLKNHKWLEDEFPRQYAILVSLNGTRNTKQSAASKGIIYPLIISPLGEMFNVTNIRHFALAHKLDNSHLGAVLKGKAKSHKGWKLYEEH